ncbi:hypothetical protein BABINDRAFT_162694 [Babjeviella inositovora NRRL Y-12698]|uniref:Uncharacterized protein n=1 Tax=Babjeviella inositovora NRRL Y-12698 TaxID=984486 RepID=A0A1E3QLZ0_9ASCO|nr:uncharacterized protein BABINDRAFT_162694 [Babjeviella inositovora NRRL Y-12698]ODQ78484.1 hypothetical protein BABINDRAFT_162694 [Babjeviella inositovora NRRL Y-12698]
MSNTISFNNRVSAALMLGYLAVGMTAPFVFPLISSLDPKNGKKASVIYQKSVF